MPKYVLEHAMNLAIEYVAGVQPALHFGVG